MSEKMKHTPDLKEIPPFSHPEWLAGDLEIGGSMSFEIMNNRRGDRVFPYARPIIKLGDQALDRIETLRSIIGGRIDQSQPKTSYVLVRGDRAAWLAYSIRPYAPSRADVITAFLSWSSAETTEDRITIAEQVRGRRVLSTVTPNDYIHLVTNPEFVGGIIDGRGSVVHNEAPDTANLSSWTYTSFHFTSVNSELLSALQNQFGGSIELISRVGETVTIRGIKTILHNDIFKWVIGFDVMKKMNAWAKPRLSLSNA